MAELSVSARLVRMIDGSIMNRHPVVAAHGSSVIVYLDGHTRLVVKRNRVIMVDPCTPTGVRLNAALAKALGKRKCPSSLAIRQDDTDHDDDELEEEVPFMIRALDGVLKFSTAEMDNQLYTLANAVSSILIQLAQDASDESLQKLIPIKSSLAAFRVQVKEFKEAVDDVATDEKQLRRFDLEASFTSNHDQNASAAQSGSCSSTPLGPDSDTPHLAKLSKTPRSLVNIQAHLDLVEEIFDHYYYIADEIDNEVEQLIKDIRAHEEVLAIQLDTQRNQLINLNLFVSTGAFVAGCSSMLAGLFGMNTHVEDSLGSAGLSQAAAFPLVAGSIFGLAGATSFGLYRVYRSKVHGRETAVQAQVVMEKLFWHADRVETILLKTYGAHVSLDRTQLDRVLTAAIEHERLTKGEITSVYNLFVGSDHMVQADFFLSVLHQRKQATRAHPRL